MHGTSLAGTRLARRLALASASALAATSALVAVATGASATGPQAISPVPAQMGIAAGVPEVAPAVEPAVAVPDLAVPDLAVPGAAVPDIATPAIAQAATLAAVRTTEQAQFAAFTLGSPQALDKSGIEPSLYRGRFYRSAIEPKRLCIVRRESEGHYFSVNHTGKYRGAYQVSPELARGATWMMLPEHEQLLGSARAQALMAQLRTTPFDRWTRYWQDALFSTVMNWKYTGSGAKHWAGGRWTC